MLYVTSGATTIWLLSEDLNCHFLSIVDKLAEALPLTSVSPVSFCLLASSVFHLSEVSESTIISIINGLESKKATGVDDIPVRFIKADLLEVLLLGLLILVSNLEFFLICGNPQWLLQFRKLKRVLN